MSMRDFVRGLPLLLLLAMVASPSTRAADPGGTIAEFHISASQLEDALSQLGAQSGLQVVYAPEVARGLKTPSVSGRLTVDAALQRLLAGSGITWSYINGDTVVLKRAQAKKAPEKRAAELDNEATALEPSSQLEEITVTATRRAESVEKVPISINALSQGDLTAGGIKSVADIAAVTPGFQFTTPQGLFSTITTISIRGIDTGGGPSTVGVYLDDTPIQSRINFITNVGNPYPMVFDLNRVEVERGPQGTLFGAGSEAGTVRFISNAPSLTEFSGFSHAELATTQNGDPSYEIGAAAGGPLVEDRLGFRVSAWTRQDGGYVDRVDPITGSTVERNANKNVESALGAALTFRVNDITITPSVHYQSLHQSDSGAFWGAFSNPSQGHFAQGALLPNVMTESFTLASVKAEAKLPFADLTSTTSYTHRNVAGVIDVSAFWGALFGGYGSPQGPAFPTSQSDAAPIQVPNSTHAVTQEVRLASNQPDAFLTWVAGVFYDHRTQLDAYYGTSLFFDPTGALVVNYQQQSSDDQIAAYFQGDLHITRHLTATLGERIARVKSELLNNIGPGVIDVGLPPVFLSSSKETPSTPRVALSYQLDPDNLFYVSASKGFRIGGGNIALPQGCDFNVPGTYKPDYLWSYEVGAKDKLFDGRVQIDSSVFHIRWSQIQQLVTLPCGSYFANAGDAVSNGFDLALKAALTQQLRLGVNIGFANAYFTSDVRDPSGNLLVQSGDKVGFLPQVNAPWNVSTSADYQIPLSQDRSVHTRVEYQYNSRNPGPFVTQIPTSISYYPQAVPDPPTHLTNARIGYTHGKLDISLFVQNVFNAHPLLGEFQSAPTSNLFYYSTLRPRTVGLTANVGF
jgi:iron complex outermembrane recepter protein